jgi:hypothetical protein
MSDQVAQLSLREAVGLRNRRPGERGDDHRGDGQAPQGFGVHGPDNAPDTGNLRNRRP